MIPDLRIIVALPAEAKPINRHFSLIRDNRIEAYPLYRNNQITLLRCGVGWSTAKKATDWLIHQYPVTADTHWLNIGVAGHASLPVGTMIQASVVLNDKGERITLGETLPPSTFVPQEILTLDRPREGYPENGACDMEAYGFLKALSDNRVTNPIHCIKIISDNLTHPVSSLNAKRVSGLIRDNLSLIATQVQ